MNNYQTWLETPNIVRIAIAQVQVISGGSTTTRYISTHPVTVDGTTYLPIIRNSISIDENISTDYSASISYGDLEIINSTGTYDSWINGDIWVNKPIKIYVGSLPSAGATSTISDFELVFDGLVDDIDSKSRTSLNLKLRDKLEKLNTSVSENLLGNYYQGSTVNEATYSNQYKNNLKPITYGEVHNITPLLTDPTMLEYMVNDGEVEQIIEVRDNGMPVAFTQTGVGSAIPAGSFRLLRNPVGTITCSVQGMKRTVNVSGSSSSSTYTNTAANTILNILKFHGQTLDYSEIDSSSFSSLGSQYVGVYLNDRVNVLNICQEIAKSCGLILTTTRTGKVKLVSLSIPSSASMTITDSDTLLNSLKISQKLDVMAGVKLGYARNWTIQNNLITAIPQQHKDLYAVEWLESSQTDSTVKTNYSVTIEPALESSYLISGSQADAVALTKLNLFKVQRKIITATCTAKFLSVQVGDAIRIVSSRFNLSGGVYGRVVSTKPNWLGGTIEIGVLV